MLSKDISSDLQGFYDVDREDVPSSPIKATRHSFRDTSVSATEYEPHYLFQFVSSA